MELTAIQQDALIELLNIGFGRAAASLSQLTGHRVLLEVPQVTLQAVDEVGDCAANEWCTDTSPACTRFSPGPVAGDALLILDRVAARRCSRSCSRTSRRCRCRSTRRRAK